MPTAKPMMPDSASGVSKHRSSPKSRVRPSVTRKTPPRAPTSSPKTTTFSSAARASRSAVFKAWAMVSTGMGSVLLGLGGQFGFRLRLLLTKLRGLFGEDVPEQVHRVGGPVDVHAGTQRRCGGLGVRGEGLRRRIVEQTRSAQVLLQPGQRVAPEPLLH